MSTKGTHSPVANFFSVLYRLSFLRILEITRQTCPVLFSCWSRTQYPSGPGPFFEVTPGKIHEAKDYKLKFKNHHKWPYSQITSARSFLKSFEIAIIVQKWPVFALRNQKILVLRLKDAEFTTKPNITRGDLVLGINLTISVRSLSAESNLKFKKLFYYQ